MEHDYSTFPLPYELEAIERMQDNTNDPQLFEKTYWMLSDCFDTWELCEGDKERKMRKLIYKIAERIVDEKDDD
jgi:hypothetical protein